MERVAPFTLRRPATLADASALLATEPGARAIAGGTDLVPNLRDGLEAPSTLVDLSAIRALSSIEFGEACATIGAGVTLATLVRDSRIARAFPVVAEAAAAVAGPTHRSTGTLGGNLCLDTRCMFYNQSEWWRSSNGYCLKRGGTVCHVAPEGTRCFAAFSGDLAPALLVLDSDVMIADAHRTRRLPLSDLYRDDGASCLTLGPAELLASVEIPVQPTGSRSGYRKIRVRGAVDFPLAGVAMRLVLDDDRIASLRVALTGTNSRPLLAGELDAFAGRRIDEALVAEVGRCVQRQARPMRTTTTGSHYRRQVVGVMVRRLLRDLAAGVQATC